jgi:LysR family transcriptional regulator, transcriptional activator for bauABCD operon
MQKLANVDIKLLRVFSAIVEAGGFAAAQAQLNLSASRISTLVADLEARLNMRLCQRGRVGFRLTEKGRAVYDASQALFGAHEAFRAKIGDLGGRLTGELQIGIVDNTLSNSDCRLAEAIGRFHRRDNDVQVTLHILGPRELERAVLDGRIQLAIGSFHHHVPGLSYQALFSEEQTLYCGRSHWLFKRPASGLSTAEIAKSPFADRGYMEGLKPKQPAQFHASAKANYMEALAFLILSGHYIAYLPTHYAAPWVAAGQMRSLLPDKLAYQSLFELITRKGVQPTPAHHAFLEDLWEAHRLGPAAPLPTPRQDPKPPARQRRRTVSRASAAS